MQVLWRALRAITPADADKSELRPILDAAAVRENDLVMNRRLIVGDAVGANLSTQFHRILERAGVKLGLKKVWWAVLNLPIWTGRKE